MPSLSLSFNAGPLRLALDRMTLAAQRDPLAFAVFFMSINSDPMRLYELEEVAGGVLMAEPSCALLDFLIASEAAL